MRAWKWVHTRNSERQGWCWLPSWSGVHLQLMTQNYWYECRISVGFTCAYSTAELGLEHILDGDREAAVEFGGKNYKWLCTVHTSACAYFHLFWNSCQVVCNKGQKLHYWVCSWEGSTITIVTHAVDAEGVLRKITWVKPWIEDIFECLFFFFFKV